MSADRCKKCGRWAEDATWWDKIPAEDRGETVFLLGIFGLLALICMLAAL